MPSVTRNHPQSQAKGVRDLPHIKDKYLADKQFDVPGKVDILLGLDIWADILLPGLAKGPPGTPVASYTVFGWAIAGSYTPDEPVNHQSPQVHYCALATHQTADPLLPKPGELDEMSKTPQLLPPEEQKKEEEDTSTAAQHVPSDDQLAVGPDLHHAVEQPHQDPSVNPASSLLSSASPVSQAADPTHSMVSPDPTINVSVEAEETVASPKDNLTPPACSLTTCWLEPPEPGARPPAKWIGTDDKNTASLSLPLAIYHQEPPLDRTELHQPLIQSPANAKPTAATLHTFGALSTQPVSHRRRHCTNLHPIRACPAVYTTTPELISSRRINSKKKRLLPSISPDSDRERKLCQHQITTVTASTSTPTLQDEDARLMTVSYHHHASTSTKTSLLPADDAPKKQDHRRLHQSMMPAAGEGADQTIDQTRSQGEDIT